MTDDTKKLQTPPVGARTSHGSHGAKKNDPFVVLILGLEESGKSSFANQLLRIGDLSKQKTKKNGSGTRSSKTPAAEGDKRNVTGEDNKVEDEEEEEELFDTANSTRKVQIEEGVFRHPLKTLRDGEMKERTGVKLKVIDTPYLLREKKPLMDALKEIGTKCPEGLDVVIVVISVESLKDQDAEELTRLDLLLIKLFGNQSWDRVRFVVTHTPSGSKLINNRKFKLMISRVGDSVTFIANGPGDPKKSKEQATISVIGSVAEWRDRGARRLSSVKLLNLFKEFSKGEEIESLFFNGSITKVTGFNFMKKIQDFFSGDTPKVAVKNESSRPIQIYLSPPRTHKYLEKIDFAVGGGPAAGNVGGGAGFNFSPVDSGSSQSQSLQPYHAAVFQIPSDLPDQHLTVVAPLTDRADLYGIHIYDRLIMGGETFRVRDRHLNNEPVFKVTEEKLGGMVCHQLRNSSSQSSSSSSSSPSPSTSQGTYIQANAGVSVNVSASLLLSPDQQESD